MEKIAENIIQTLIDVLPEEWDRLVLFGELDKSSYEFFFYVKVDGKYIQCYQLPETYENLTEDDIDDAFGALYNLCLENKNANWNCFTMTVEGDGAFSIDYDFGEDYLDRDAWKSKYLV